MGNGKLQGRNELCRFEIILSRRKFQFNFIFEKCNDVV